MKLYRVEEMNILYHRMKKNSKTNKSICFILLPYHIISTELCNRSTGMGHENRFHENLQGISSIQHSKQNQFYSFK